MTPKLKAKLAFAGVATAVAAGTVVLSKDFRAPDATPSADRKEAVNRAEKADRMEFAALPQSVARANKAHAEVTALATATVTPLMTGAVRSVTIDGPDFGDVMDPAPATKTAERTGPIDGPDFGDVEDSATATAETAELRTGPIDGPDFGDVEDTATTRAVTSAKAVDDAKPSRTRKVTPRTVAAEPERGPLVIIPGYADATPDGPSAIVPSRAPAPAKRSTNIATDPSDARPVK